MNYGFIFDLDGLLVNTQLPFHASAESRIFLHYGLDLKPEEISERYAGISTRKIFKELLPQCDADELVREKWRIMKEMALIHPPLAMPSMLEACHFLKNRHIPISIASASPKEWIELCIGQRSADLSYNFLDLFENHYVSAEECANGKPAPDVFLLAKDRLVISGERQWVVVGDGESDVLAGLAAQMDVLYLSDKNTAHDQNSRVRRFSTSLELADYIKGLVTN